eukprot:TRINITY_DN24808_c0_g1_i1.p2 TRINITY_DN24808_c0_g1~~TRINITY_DN24808_c0_g1_i1.p2  ORF type:complete len:219 (-),score=40.93 TRINITY_DN24808_c0_g1_i1:380-1036(-)
MPRLAHLASQPLASHRRRSGRLAVLVVGATMSCLLLRRSSGPSLFLEGAAAQPGSYPRRFWLAAVSAATAGVAGGDGAYAISGGGKDYASTTIDADSKLFAGGRDFSAKDFSGCVAKSVDFSTSKYVGSRFNKADLTGASFANADCTGASFESAELTGADFTGAKLDGAYFSNSILEAKSLKGAILSDALLPQKVVPQLCEREDVSSSKPTSDSLGCS